MARVSLTPHLRRYFDLPETVDAEGATVAEVLAHLDARWPGLAFYVTDEQGRLRKHVAIWVDGRRVEDRDALSDAVADTAHVHVLQALSGG
jgi:sulfur carrier protein ThiS